MIATQDGCLAMAEIRPRLEDGYYLKNFCSLLKTIEERYHDLLAPTELRFVDQFRALSEPSQRLYIRLISRKGPLFRQDRLKYWDIPDIESAAKELLTRGFLSHGQTHETDEWLSLLVVPELRRWARDHWTIAVKSHWNRSTLLAAVLKACSREQLWQSLQSELVIIKPEHHEKILLFRLLFFGNLHQDLTDFVLQDLGIFRYEAYEWGQEHRLFADRDAVEQCFELLERSQFIEHLLYEQNLDDACQLADRLRETASSLTARDRRITDRIFNQLGRCLERARDHERALIYFEHAVSPPARERRARILFKDGRFEEAQSLCEEIQCQPRDETEVDFGPRFLRKTLKKLGHTLDADKRSKRRVQRFSLIRDVDLSIEDQVLGAFKKQGQEGIYGENGLWRSLFGLAFWDIIFSPVKGAFEHPFQHGPLDLHSPDFRRNREQLIDARLGELRAERELEDRLLRVYDSKYGLANPFVAWDSWQREVLERVIEAIGGCVLADICDRLSRDLRRYRRGFPDLFLFTKSGFELCEVKGPGDQLRAEQRSWLGFFESVKIPAFVARVEWIDV
jgi:tetratricopeptide (TPR) repeat protein